MPCPRRRPIHSRSLPGWAYQSLTRIAASLSSARPGYLIGLSGCALPPQLARILQSLQTGVDRRVVLGKAEPHDIGEDRKRDVEGKSVSVRVVLGGRRSIKKKKTQTA